MLVEAGGINHYVQGVLIKYDTFFILTVIIPMRRQPHMYLMRGILINFNENVIKKMEN